MSNPSQFSAESLSAMASLLQNSSNSANTIGNTDSVINLADYIDLGHCEVLNSNNKTYLKSILSTAATTVNSDSIAPVTIGLLQSDPDVDNQLIIKITFKEAIKLRGIKFIYSNNTTTINPTDNSLSTTGIPLSDISGPSLIKLYVNNLNLSFSDTDTITPTETIKLTESQLLTGNEIRVKYVKYQSVYGLTIFISNNQLDSSVTQLNGLGFIGTIVEGMKVNEIKKIDEHSH